MAMSAVSSVSTFGVLVTVMPRRAAASMSILSTPLEKLAISFQLRSGLFDQRLVDPVGHRRHQHVGVLNGFQKRLAAAWHVVDVKLASNNSRMRVSTRSGSLRVM